MCRLSVYIRKRQVVTDFFRRVEAAACPDLGHAGVQWVFFGDGNWPGSRKGSRSSPGPKTMMGWVQRRYKRWDAERCEWTTRVVPVDEYNTTRCCRFCGAHQQDGKACKLPPESLRPSPEPTPKGCREWQWRRYWHEIARHNRWHKRERDGRYRPNKPCTVRGLKICGSRSCGSQQRMQIRSRDGNATWWIGCAGRALIEGRPRPAHLQRPPVPQRPRLVAAQDIFSNRGGTPPQRAAPSDNCRSVPSGTILSQQLLG